MNIIETHQLTRHFGRTEAVERMDLAVPEGAVCALLGPNGSGKTTTIKLLMNLIRPTGGTAQVLGVDTRRLGERERAQIGYVAEDQQLPDWMTVRQLLDYCRPFYPTWDRALERDLLDRFELPAGRKLKHLSRGMRMKAALLSALAYHPRLLILDEPFSGLDPVMRDDFVRGVLEVSAQGEWTVFVSSHDVAEIEQLVDRVALLDAGRLRLNEPADTLRARFRRVEVTGAPAAVTADPNDLHWERAGKLTRFVAADYVGGGSEQRWRERFAGATVTVAPMTLREIFVALVRPARVAQEGVAA